MEIVGSRVRSVDRSEGVGIVLDDDSTILVRLSGTEPLARVYIQAASNERLNDISDSIRSMSEGT